jgi:hypothetical protein
LIVAIIGLWFGFLILNITGEMSDLGGGEKALRIVFGIVWFTFWVGAMVYNVLNLSASSRAKKSDKARTAGTRAESALGDRKEEKPDFEARIRKLESLRKDGLVSEEEYRRKREEFLQEKW